MSVINTPVNTVNAETSMLVNNELAVLQNIWLELKILNENFRQAFNLQDSDASIRNSMTVNDLTNIS